MDHSTKFFERKKIAEYLEELNIHFFEGQLVVPIVATDDGYAQINSAFMCIEMVDKKPVLRIVEDTMPSLGRRGRHTAGMAGGSVNLYGLQKTSEEYTISPWVASPEDTRSKDYATTPLNLALIHASLDRLGLAGEKIALLTSLPLKQFMDGENNVNTNLIRKKHENLMQPVYIGPSKKPSAQVVYAGTYPEAVSGIVDYLIDEYGNFQEGINPNVVRLALDIGGNTTDLAIVLPGNQIGAYQTVEYGVKHVKDRLRHLLIQRFGNDPDDQLLEDALKTKQVSWFGDEVEDVAAEVADAIAYVMDPILSEVDQFKKQFPSLREIVGFGGGVALMENVIRERYPNIIVLENADGANARGILKYVMVYDLESVMTAVRSFLEKLNQEASQYIEAPKETA